MTTDQMLEQEAALLEGLAEMPEDLVPLREKRLKLKAKIDTLQQEADEIRDTFGTRLESEGLQGYMLHGKVKARRTDVTNTRADSKMLKADFPEIWAKVVKVTKSVRVVID